MTGARSAGDVIDGRYEVLRVHGDGAMGLVYRVRHLRWGTDLAMKCPRPGLFATAADRDRFVTEAETWVSLGLHPNVCGCHYVRVIDGVPCVFAEYVAGGSLKERIADRSLHEGGAAAALARILDVAVQFARGLEHAHAHGLVHQDVKPANVLLDTDGTVKVTDFGLARTGGATVSGAPGRGSAGGTVLVPTGGLTPAYASPEQSAGGPLGRRSDVYSFGVSVLEMFTGGVGWMAGPVAGAALESHLADGPDDPALPAVPPDVAALLARCLAPVPADRPATMARVADELTAVYHRVTGRRYPRAIPEPAELRADELNNRALSLLDLDRADEAEEAFTAALAADPRHLEALYNSGLLRWRRGSLVGGLAPDGPEGGREPVTDSHLLARLRTDGTDADADRQSRVLRAHVHLERGDTRTARQLLEELEREHPHDPEVRGPAEALRSGRAGEGSCAGSLELPWSHEEESRHLRPSVRLTADSLWAMRKVGRFDVQVWDLGRSRLALTLTDTEPDAVDVTADGRTVVSSHTDGLLRFWDPERGGLLHRYALPGWSGGAPDPVLPRRAGLVRLAVDGRHFAVVAGREAQLWPAAAAPGLRPVRRRPLEGYRDHAWLAVSDFGGWALGGTAGGGAALWDLGTGRHRLNLAGDGDRVTTAFVNADGRHALTASRNHLSLWDLTDGRCLGRVLTGTGLIHTMWLSPDARLALVGGADRNVRLWDLRAGRCLRTFSGHTKPVYAVLMGTRADRGASVDASGTLLGWTWRLPGSYTAPMHPSRPRRATERQRLDRDAGALAAGAERALADGLHRRAHELLVRARKLPGHERQPRLLDAWWRLGAATGFAGLRTAWPVRSFPPVADTRVDDIAIGADGRTAASAHGSKGVYSWNLATGRSRHRPYPETLFAVGIGREDGRVLAGGDALVVWRGDAGPRRAADARINYMFKGVSFSADGRRALTADRRTVRLWDLDTGRCLRELTGHSTSVSAVAMSGYGRWAASADLDRGVRVWDLFSGRCRHVLLDGRRKVSDQVGISADGRRLLCYGLHGGRLLWDTATGERLTVFDEEPGVTVVGRLTPDGRHAVTGDSDGHVRVWDTGSGRCLHALGGHAGMVSSLAITPDARFVVSGGGDGTVRLWELDWEPSTGDGGDGRARG
ncbi:protein kinase [Streptomyces sp. NPDC002466]|uniref:protein kinase domain-containing protein n=1 Tax=Streptomyces sp. NPDC002466 TaxID=3364646 RepID=UPI00367BBC67